DLRGVVVLDPEDDRLVFAFAEALVDARGERAHPDVELLVLLDRAARRRRDLDERELADPARLELEEPLDGAEALQYAFGVIEPIHPDAELHRRRQAERLAHAAAAFGHRRLHLQRRGRPFDRDWVAPYFGRVAAVRDGKRFPVDARFEEAVDRIEEVVAVELRVEAEDRRAQQPVEDLLAPGQ